MTTWRDDDNAVIMVVSAEQHALDHPGHTLTVCATEHPNLEGLPFIALKIECTHKVGGPQEDGSFQDACGWWDEQLIPIVVEETEEQLDAAWVAQEEDARRQEGFLRQVRTRQDMFDNYGYIAEEDH